MRTYLNHRGVELALLVSAFFVVALFIPGDAMACFDGGECMEKTLPGPAAGGLAVAAIIGTLVIAKMRRRK